MKSTQIRLVLIFVAVLVLIGVAWYGEEIHERDVPPTPAVSGQPELANPASVNCVHELGGTLQITEEANGEAGYCRLPDGRVCEEWGLFRDKTCAPPPGTPSAATSAPAARNRTL